MMQQEAETVLLQRLEALEQVVFGRKAPTPQEARVDELGTKVVGIAKRVSRVEGGNRDLQHIATQASSLGLLSPVTSSIPVAENVELKEGIVLAAREEIEVMAKLFAQVKALEAHINPPYLRDIPQLSARLRKLEGAYVGQAADAAWINKHAESARLHYSQAVSLISEKFVHWDDQVANLEREHESSGGNALASAS